MLLAMHGIRKRFGAVCALSGVDLRVLPGEVHALIGENGAGKSTLMKILAGVLSPDDGDMRLAGAPYHPTGPRGAQALGIAMIHQELNLADDLGVVENIVLGREPRRLGWFDRKAAVQRARVALARLGREELVDNKRIGDLGPGPRQLVEVARALTLDARIVVMDEPTSSLSQEDTEHLFAAITRLKQAGVSVIYISHFLEEVLRIADRYTVLRDGRSVHTGAVAQTSEPMLVRHMVGRAIDEVFPRVEHTPGPPLLSLSNVAGTRLPVNASLTLYRGEILGLFGLIGAGRSELLRVLYGLDPVRNGDVRVAHVAGRDAERAHDVPSPRATGTGVHGRAPWVRLAQGVGLLSENRKDEGLALTMTIADNLTLSHLSHGARFGFVSRAWQRERLRRWADVLAIRTGGPALDANAPVGTLSGGNQQKVALARLLDMDIHVLLLDEPTRGIDVGSKTEIYRLIGELAANGKAVLFVSSYVPELLGVCDRIAVMHRGTLLPAAPVADLSEATLMTQATGGAKT